VTKTIPRNPAGRQLAPVEERRRSQRVMVRVPVTIEFTAAGKKMTVHASTASVNDHGAMLLCPRTFTEDTPLQVQNQRTGEIQMCRITRAPVENREGYLIPVEFAAPARDFWRISFPPSDWKPLDD